MATLLTAPAVAKLKHGPTRRIIKDGGAQSLYLVVQPSGHKSWLMRFRRPGGKPGKLVLGPVDLSGREFDGKPVIGQSLTLAAARWLAGEVLHQKAKGEDPIADHKARKQQRRTEIKESEANTYGTLVCRYVAEYLKANRKARKWRYFAKQLGLAYPKDGGEPTMTRHGLAQRWRTRDVRTIDDGEILSVVNEARRKGTPGIVARKQGLSEGRARDLHTALSSFFGWLAHPRSGRILKTNPCAGLAPEADAEPRDRVLRPEEIAKFWHACDKVSVPFGAVFRLLLLTGQRLNEVAGMRWDELNGAMWELPGSRTKNKKPHKVPLSPLAMKIINSVPRLEGCPFVFSTTGSTPISGWSKVKRDLDKAMGHPREWVLHDLRHTAATHMDEMRIQPVVIELILNHISGVRRGIAGRYNKGERMEERREALNRWSTHISELVSGEPTKVVKLRSR
jgi:integrase